MEGPVKSGPTTTKNIVTQTETKLNRKADVGSQVPNGSVTTLQPTSKTPLVSSSASDNTISQRQNAVNDYSMQKGGENSNLTTEGQNDIFNVIGSTENTKCVIESERNTKRIEVIRKGVENGTHRKTEDIRRMLDKLNGRNGDDGMSGTSVTDRRANINDGEIPQREREGDGRGDFGESSRNTRENQIKYSIVGDGGAAIEKIKITAQICGYFSIWRRG